MSTSGPERSTVLWQGIEGVLARWGAAPGRAAAEREVMAQALEAAEPSAGEEGLSRSELTRIRIFKFVARHLPPEALRDPEARRRLRAEIAALVRSL